MKISFLGNNDIFVYKYDPDVDLNFILVICDYPSSNNVSDSTMNYIQQKFKDLSKVIILPDYSCFYRPETGPPRPLKNYTLKTLDLWKNYQYQNFNFIYIHYNIYITSSIASLVKPNYTNIILSQIDVKPDFNDHLREYTDTMVDIIVQKNKIHSYCWTSSYKYGIMYYYTQSSRKRRPYLQINAVPSFI